MEGVGEAPHETDEAVEASPLPSPTATVLDLATDRVQPANPQRPPRQRRRGSQPLLLSTAGSYYLPRTDLFHTTGPVDTPSDKPPAPPTDGLRGHIILCGLPSYAGGLRDFVLPLRACARFAHTAECPAVLLLQPEPPGRAVWRRACEHGPIYWMRGTSADMDDLVAAGLEHAVAIVVPSDPSSSLRIQLPETIASGASVTNLLHRIRQGAAETALYEDATTVLTCREIDSLTEVSARLVCELRHVSNMDFIRRAGWARRCSVPCRLDPSGDSRAVEDAEWVRHPRRRRAGGVGGDPPARRPRAQPFAPACAFSRVLEMPHLPELLEALILGGPSGGCLQQWPLPKELAHGTTYAELVELFARTHAAIPLGLIRRTGRSHPSERHSVLAAPPPSTVLMLHDRVFVLSPGNDPVPARI